MERMLTEIELTKVMEHVRMLVGEQKHVLLVVCDAGREERPFQYIATTERAETIKVFRDLADALEQRPPAPNPNLS